MKPLIPSGPMQSEAYITAHLDYYKMTMSQFAYEKFPELNVTFGYKNRTEVPLAEFVNIEDLQQELDRIGNAGFSEDERDYLATLQTPQGEQMFSDEYLDAIIGAPLPEVVVDGNELGDLRIESTGDWPTATFWETITMSVVTQRYFEEIVKRDGLDIFEVYEEGNNRLTDKIDKINNYNETVPEDAQQLKFIDFGTRRHFSLRWHEHVVGRLKEELPDDVFLSTSNVYFAKKLGLNPSGTFAHEMPMVYAGMNDDDPDALRASHGDFLDQWNERYPHLSVALTDTFGTDFFFDDLDENQRYLQWNGLRHDSGDPFEFGEKVLEFYRQREVDTQDKTIVFSDGLDVDLMIELHKAFGDKVNIVFGIGTNLTCDLGLKAVSHVMKATKVGDAFTVKLSDNPNKFTGPEEQTDRYARIFNYDAATKEAVATRY